jgi:hypothetical protein
MDQKLEKAQWRAFFDRTSQSLAGKRAEIEIASLDLGDQIEAEWLPLIGMTYDAKGDLIEVALEGLDHLIRRPHEVYFLDQGGRLVSVDVVDADGRHHIVKLKDPLLLPPPGH